MMVDDDEEQEGGRRRSRGEEEEEEGGEEEVDGPAGWDRSETEHHCSRNSCVLTVFITIACM